MYLKDIIGKQICIKIDNNLDLLSIMKELDSMHLKGYNYTELTTNMYNLGYTCIHISSSEEQGAGSELFYSAHDFKIIPYKGTKNEKNSIAIK